MIHTPSGDTRVFNSEHAVFGVLTAHASNIGPAHAWSVTRWENAVLRFTISRWQEMIESS
jgi:hypothetical protein